MIVPIDPGIRGSGVAVFNETTRALVRAAYVRNPDPRGSGLEAQYAMAKAILKWLGAQKVWEGAVLLGEWMQVYPPGSSGRSVDPNRSLLPLVGVVAHVSGMGDWGERVSYRPHEWKKTLNGDAMTKRILGRLSDTEKNAIEPAPEDVFHNAVDAVGIGLFHLGRLEPRRVIRR